MVTKTRLVLEGGETLDVKVLYSLATCLVVWNTGARRFQIIKKDWVVVKETLTK